MDRSEISPIEKLSLQRSFACMISLPSSLPQMLPAERQLPHGENVETRAASNKVSISRRQLFELLVNALRYAIDRSTYVTTEVADAIREHWSVLSPQERHVIYRDVCKGIDDEVTDARAVWQPLKTWIEAVP